MGASSRGVVEKKRDAVFFTFPVDDVGLGFFGTGTRLGLSPFGTRRGDNK
jgi:hypothetical protein